MPAGSSSTRCPGTSRFSPSSRAPPACLEVSAATRRSRSGPSRSSSSPRSRPTVLWARWPQGSHTLSRRSCSVCRAGHVCSHAQVSHVPRSAVPNHLRPHRLRSSVRWVLRVKAVLPTLVAFLSRGLAHSPADYVPYVARGMCTRRRRSLVCPATLCQTTCVHTGCVRQSGAFSVRRQLPPTLVAFLPRFSGRPWPRGRSRRGAGQRATAGDFKGVTSVFAGSLRLTC